MHYLYWIHLENHSDPFTEGYIEISTQPKIRFRQHTTDTAPRGGSTVLRQIAAEIGAENLRHTLLTSFPTEEEAQIEERRYRPKSNIGWNIQPGGGVTPDCSGRQDSPETKMKRAASIRKTKSSRSYISPFKGMTDRHSPETRALIGSYHKGKTISEAHRKSASAKLSGDKNPNAVSVDLQDLETHQIYNFKCLKTASDELGINYSTLRSAIRCKQEIVSKKWKILCQGVG